MSSKLIASGYIMGATLLGAAVGFAIEAFVAAAASQPAIIIFQQPIFLIAPIILGTKSFCLSSAICYRDIISRKPEQELTVKTEPPIPIIDNTEVEALRNADNSRRNSYSADESANKKLDSVTLEMTESVSNLQTVLTELTHASPKMILSGGPSAQPFPVVGNESPPTGIALLKNDHLKTSFH